MNEHLIQKTNRVLETLVDLAQLGAEVSDISIGLRNPVITLFGPPTNLKDVSTVRIARTTDSGREVVRSASIRGCQVEWRDVA